MLDGRPIHDYDVRHLRRHIGVVSQDNILFSNSIYQNIIYGMGQGHLPEATEADVWAACDAANVTEFVHTFPAVRKTASFFEFSLCLSRACLGKMIVFIYKWLKTAVLRRASTPSSARKA
jgi:ABC-type multidrug transport system fused ATPase/permease subunit